MLCVCVCVCARESVSEGGYTKVTRVRDGRKAEQVESNSI
jgi:hypothetical protein